MVSSELIQVAVFLAAAAIAAGRFSEQIVPVDIVTRKGTTQFATDEHVKAETSLETLAKMKPAFKKDGSVTAVLSSGDGGAGRNLWQSLTHFSEVNYALPTSLATVGIAAYEALPADLKGIVDEAAAETERRQWSAIRTRLDENYARMRANGVTIHAGLPADLTQRLAAAGKVAVDEWRVKAGPEGAAILDAFAKRGDLLAAAARILGHHPGALTQRGDGRAVGEADDDRCAHRTCIG